MRDTAVVESIVAGDSGGLAVAYDEYADLIYAYCRSMLGDQEETADAVQATFVNAAANAYRLHNPAHLRAWLFALARNQCILGRRPAQAAGLNTGALSMAAGNDADRALVRAAIDGLSSGERDVLTLLWHGLDAGEAALVLALSRNEVYSRFSRARDQLETCVAVLLVCYNGRRDCPALDELLSDWDGYLTERLRDAAARHIEGCVICAGRRDREVRPAVLLSLTPGALLRAAEEARAMARPAPPWLRDRLMWLVTTDDPQAEAERRAMDRRLAPFGNMGFPRPRHTTRAWPPALARPRLVFGMAGGLAAIAVVAGLIVIPGGAPRTARTGADAGAGAGSSLQSGAVDPGASQSASATQSARPSPSRHTASPQASVTTAESQAPLAAPQPTTPATGPAQGTLSVSPSSITVAPPFDSTITVTAHGAPVTWSVSIPSAAAGQISVSPASGALSAGQSVTVSVSARNANNFRTVLTFSPGGHHVTVTVGLG